MSKTFDRFLSLILILVCGILIFESTKILESSIGSTIGPGLLPMVLAIILGLLSIVNFYQTFQMRYADEQKEKLEYKRFIMMVVSATLYCLLIVPLGYVISTFLFLIVGFQLMEKGKVLYSVIFAAMVSFSVYYVYVEIMKGTLPGLPEWIGL